MNMNKEIGFFISNLFSKIFISILAIFSRLSGSQNFHKRYYYYIIVNCHLQCKKNIFTAKKTYDLLMLSECSKYRLFSTISNNIKERFVVNWEQVKLKIGSVLNA
ncbi:MAG: hypothetical protein OEV78_09975 [Spirochaetia bacterium]|nr:hypothetical protein [Spirochaetia bacterium]